MNKILLFSFLFISSISFAQIVKGKVVDQNNQPLPGSNIYFDGTTIATIADENGNFSLNYGSKLNSILAVSFIGYQTQFIKSFDDKDLTIVLKEAANTLNEVVIRKDRFSRKQKLQLFREQFLGQTKTGKKAVIENEDDLYFDYDEKTFTIKGYSDKPLIVNNSLLGYKISYELVDFEVCFFKISISSSDVVKSYYAGLTRFEETNSNAKILNQREKCYQGSQLHFFRNLVANIWNKENFLLFKGSYQDNPNDYFTISDFNDSKKVVVTKQKKELSLKKFVAEFNLLFNKKQQSKIIFETETFYVDKFGNNSNLENIFFSGYMAQQKVGDMLPMNYGIK
ncbi:carboxypeptidase-like regulatory domain-containing protein [Flavobacterium sp.]|uniref:carboxypeptidase-like regulatory domain-containing protein n=1 Tax=Flavobacterium sp. TaxID=239 RepID=UPI003753C5EC